MEQEERYTIQMQNGGPKEPERRPPQPQPAPERRDIPASDPEPLVESDPPDLIEPSEDWERE